MHLSIVHATGSKEMMLQCWVCSHAFERDITEEEAEKIHFCSDDCYDTMREWARQYEEISLTRYYLLRKLTKRKNYHEPLGK